MYIAKVIPLTPPPQMHSFQQLEYGHSIMVATPTDVKRNIYSHIRTGHHRIWAGQLDGPKLARRKLI